MARTRKRRNPLQLPAYLSGTTPAAFIAQNPVFSLGDLRVAYKHMGRKPAAAREAIAYHLANGTIVHLRRGLYSHPSGVDPYVIATRLTPDAIIAYGGALCFHGLTPLRHSIQYVTSMRTDELVRNEIIYTPVRSQTRSKAYGLLDGAVSAGQPIRVTSLPATLVDCLDRVDLVTDWEELWGVFSDLKTVDWDAVLEHWKALGKSPLLASRLGVFFSSSRHLRQHAFLTQLERVSLQKPAYFHRSSSAGARGQAFVAKWQIILPPELEKLRAQSSR
ncbi:MAG: hypothetical protein QM817_35820 [Archangium sp.]